MATAANSETAPEIYFGEKWKPSKKYGGFLRIRSSVCSFSKNYSRRRCSFAGKCAALVKEQRARFYIMRRCVIMLVCWHNYSDS